MKCDLLYMLVFVDFFSYSVLFYVCILVIKSTPEMNISNNHLGNVGTYTIYNIIRGRFCLESDIWILA